MQKFQRRKPLHSQPIHLLKDPLGGLTMSLMSGANSRELSGPESSCRQDSKATALSEMAGVTRGVVKVYLHNWFIWLPPAGFSEPPNYYYQESCINYYVPEWVDRLIGWEWQNKFSNAALSSSFSSGLPLFLNIESKPAQLTPLQVGGKRHPDPPCLFLVSFRASHRSSSWWEEAY